jgi:putative phage-type endonuclease
MSAVRLGTWPVESPEWTAARAHGLGGSEIAAVLGLSKWDSHYSLWHRKSGNLPDRNLKDEMDAGRRLEPVILAWWREQHPDLVGRRAGTYASRQRPWQIANPDFIAHTRTRESADRRHHGERVGIVEAKYALYDYEWGTEDTDEVPPYYLTQAQWYLDVFDLGVCYLPMFVGSQGQFREYVINADPADQELLRTAAAEFMASLEAGEEPTIDEHSATYEAIRTLHPGIDRELAVDIPADAWLTYESTKTAADELVASHRRAKSVVLDLLGDARIGLLAGEPVLRRQPAGSNGAVALHPVKKKVLI